MEISIVFPLADDESQKLVVGTLNLFSSEPFRPHDMLVEALHGRDWHYWHHWRHNAPDDYAEPRAVAVEPDQWRDAKVSVGLRAQKMYTVAEVAALLLRELSPDGREAATKLAVGLAHHACSVGWRVSRELDSLLYDIEESWEVVLHAHLAHEYKYKTRILGPAYKKYYDLVEKITSEVIAAPGPELYDAPDLRQAILDAFGIEVEVLPGPYDGKTGWYVSYPEDRQHVAGHLIGEDDNGRWVYRTVVAGEAYNPPPRVAEYIAFGPLKAVQAMRAADTFGGASVSIDHYGNIV